MTDEEVAMQLGTQILSDADKLRLFMPDCYARIPLSWNGEQYEIQVFRVTSEPSQE